MGRIGRYGRRCVWFAALLACLVTRARAVEALLIADAHVSTARPAVNSGALSNVNVGNGYIGLLQFDLSLLPAGTTSGQVSRAILRLYVNRMDMPGSVSIQPLGGAWGEYSVTNATLPSVAGVTQIFSVTQAGAYVAVDVTSLVQGWISAPPTNYGIALTASAASIQLDSKENDQTAHPAALDIVIVSQGPTGPAGPAGPAGSVGAIGPAGPAGPAGTTTVTGLNYQGTYSSTANYAVDDVVLYQGSSYISLIAQNHGSTPGLSSQQWGLLAQGGAGPTGATGATGPSGPQGLTGPQGAQGAQGQAGAPGAAGVQGLPGLIYQGSYQSSVNYNLGDVVLWQGTTYTSLSAQNHGNTPDASPANWGVLSARGPAGLTGAPGAQGPQGVQGLPGSVGPPGSQGPQGLQGIAGQGGAQGLTGATGAQGLQGPAGPQGVAGPVGLTFRGSYQSSANYALADGILYNGAGYVSLIAANHGNTPDQTPLAWSLFAAAGAAGAAGTVGPVGATGPTGSQGLQGVQGPAGAAGATGSQGPAVVNYTGNYVSTTNYASRDAVSYGGSTYVSLVDGNHGNTPGVTANTWAVLAAQGTAGAQGPSGATGATGAVGPVGATGLQGATGPPIAFAGGWLQDKTYPIGTGVSYGGSSYVALVANTGREPDVSPLYWGVLAQAGVAGDAGAAGPIGPAGNTGPQGPSGVTGPTGPSGPTGVAATVSVGSVTTGAAGTPAKVTNSGTNSAAVLNFVLPQGAAGTGGSGGTQTLSGIPFVSTYHSVSFNSNFYSVNGSASVYTEGPAVLTWVPGACTATRLVVFSQQQNTITVSLRLGATPLSMAEAGLACTVSSGGSCSVSASVPVTAGSFVDYAITGTSGTAAAVWTALECD